MDRDTARQRIQDGLGFSTTLADKIVLRMQEEQRDLERAKTLPPFLVVEDATLNLLATTNTVALPDDFLRRTNVMMRFTPAGTTKPQTVPWRNFDQAQETFGDVDVSGPKAAVLRTSTILFFPAADVDYTLTWDYYAKDELLTTNVENLWLANAPELIIGGAGLRIAKDRRDAGAMQLFGDMYKQARSTWFGETVVQEQDDGPYCLGSNA